jgi:hypothetical protein
MDADPAAFDLPLGDRKALFNQWNRGDFFA